MLIAILALAVLAFAFGAFTLHWLLIIGAVLVLIYLFVGPGGGLSTRGGGTRTRRFF